MAKIADLFGLDITPEVRKRRAPKVTLLVSALDCPESPDPPLNFESTVFKYLLENKDALGIQQVFKFKNLKVDGAILLDDGRRLTVEMKYRMNWGKALEAVSEFRLFLLTPEAEAHPVSGGVVFFEEFEGAGWHKKPKCRVLENGWNYWYTSHSRVEGKPLDLFRLRQGQIDTYRSALCTGIIAKADTFPTEYKEQVLRAANAPRPSTPA
jgi:hypothetical protein